MSYLSFFVVVFAGKGRRATAGTTGVKSSRREGEEGRRLLRRSLCSAKLCGRRWRVAAASLVLLGEHRHPSSETYPTTEDGGESEGEDLVGASAIRNHVPWWERGDGGEQGKREIEGERRRKGEKVGLNFELGA
ncbi:unnamed protein product [Linum trigynum]|uniref:Uncharacterized protein n=1 Tax=Linum trigynum TaxID=586398 RepID=A0AAV2F881_9ROSI